MRKSVLYVVSFLLTVLLVSCGGSETTTLTNEDGTRELQVMIPQCDSSGVVTGESVDSLVGTLNIKVLNSAGESVWSQSYKDVENGMEISGIPDVTGGELVIMAFTPTDNNKAKWLGRVTNITFAKGVETKASVLLYPIDGSVSCLPKKMAIGRFGHTATLLPDGRILIAGGFSSSTDSGGHTMWNATNTVEILDVETGDIELLSATLTQPRAMHAAFALPDGSVVMVGGVRTMGMLPTTVDGYPSLPVIYETPVTSVERFTPSYPKYNLLMNGVGTQTPAKTENLILDDSHFLPYQSYDVVKVSENNFRVYIAGGLKNGDSGLEPHGGVALMTVTYNSPESVTASIADFGTAEGSLLPLIGGDGTSMLSVGGRKFGATDLGQKLSPAAAQWGTASLSNIMSGTSVRTELGSYSFGGLSLSCTSDTECTISDSSKVYELFPTATGERAGSLALTTTYSDIAYIPAFERFIIIGGVISLLKAVSNPVNNEEILQPGDGHNIILRANVNTLQGSGGASDRWNKRLNSSHLLSKTVVINESTLLVIGGVTSLGDSGESINDVEIITIQR